MKKMLFCLLGAALLLASVPALAAAPMIQSAAYEGFGYVEVDFVTDVDYQDPRIAVTDAFGAQVEADIVSLDDDDLLFQILAPEPGVSYAFTVSGVRAGGFGEYASVSGSVEVPAEGAVAIRKVEYDADDREIEIDFASLVQYQNVAVELTGADGAQIAASVVDWDEDSVEARLDSRLTLGAEYTVRVTGVRAAQDAEYGSASLVFTAYDD